MIKRKTQFTIGLDGNITITPIGVTGSGCIQQTEEIEHFLGEPGKRKLLDTYYEIPQSQELGNQEFLSC